MDDAGEIEILADDVETVDLAVEQLTSLTAASETRHTETLEGIAKCQTQLESLSNRLESLERAQTAESPQLAIVTAELAQIRVTLVEVSASLNSLRDMRQSLPRPSESTLETPEITPGETPALLVAEQSTGAPVRVETPEAAEAPPKRKRVNRL